MRIDAIAVGANPSQEVNVIIEVPIGGEPIKYELDKAAGTLVVDRFLHTPMRYPGTTASCPTPGRQTATRSTCSWPTRARSGCSRWWMMPVAMRRSPPSRSKAHQTLRTCRQLHRPAAHHAGAGAALLRSSSTTRIWSPASGSRWTAGATPRRPGNCLARLLRAPSSRVADRLEDGVGRLQGARCATKRGSTAKTGAQDDAHPPFPSASARADPCPRSDRPAL